MGDRETREEQVQTFREVTDALMECVGMDLQQIADAFDVGRVTVSRWRTGRADTRPREGWEEVVARLAREAAERHEQHAERLRGLAGLLSPPAD